MSKDPYFGFSGDKRLVTIPEEILKDCYYTFSNKCFYSFLFSGRTDEAFKERDRIIMLQPKELQVEYNRYGQLNYCLQSYKLDYQEVKIPKGSVIYCDIPYKGKTGYNGFVFDYERFYSWAEKQENIFISEEYLPEDRFKCIAERKKIRCLSATKHSDYAIEKLYIPIKNEYEKKGQIKLFD